MIRGRKPRLTRRMGTSSHSQARHEPSPVLSDYRHCAFAAGEAAFAMSATSAFGYEQPVLVPQSLHV